MSHLRQFGRRQWSRKAVPASLRGIALLSVLVSAPLLLCGEQPVYELEAQLVRAWHFEKDILEVPADVRRIDRDAIDRSLATSVPDLLESAGNLYFTSFSGATNVDLRGFGENSGLRTLVLVDGQPLNPGDMGRINWEQIPLETVESVEVLKGGQNVLYGDKALSGVIKIETRRSGGHGLEVGGRMGSFGLRRRSLSGEAGGEGWSFRGTGTAFESEGYREHSASEGHDLYFTGGYTFAGGDDWDLRLSTGESRFEYPGGLDATRYEEEPKASDKTSEGSENDYLTLTLRAQGERDWGTWEVLAGYDENDADYVFEPIIFYGRNQQDGLSLKPRFRLGGEELSLVFGYDLLLDRAEFEGYLDESRNYLEREAAIDEFRSSPYFLIEKRLSEKLSVHLGARYEWVRYEAEAAAYDSDQILPVDQTNRGPRPNPDYKANPDTLEEGTYAEVLEEDGHALEISANYKLNDHWSIFAGYDRVYRYPVFDERASYQGFPQAEEVNRSLEAEEGDNFEVGLKFREARHQVYLTSYQLKMKNEIIYDDSITGSSSVGRGLNVNLGPVDRSGFDFDYRYTRQNWGFSWKLAYVATEIQSELSGSGEGRGQEVPLVPSVVSTTQVWWAPHKDLYLRLAHRFVDERYQGSDYANTDERIESYQLVDLNLSYDLSPQCRLFFRVENLLDAHYAETAVLGSYYPGAGRSFEMGARLTF